MQLGDILPDVVNTSLYGFPSKVVHPHGMISLPLTLGIEPSWKTCLFKFLVVDVTSAYNVILGRPTLNAFQDVISTYRMKIKFPILGSTGEEETPSKRRKDAVLVEETKDREETPAKVQADEELLAIKLVPRYRDKTTRIGSQMEDTNWEKVISCLRQNINIFTWTHEDLEGIDPGIITHYLNIDSTVQLVKQKKRHFEPEKDKIIQPEDSLLVKPSSRDTLYLYLSATPQAVSFVLIREDEENRCPSIIRLVKWVVELSEYDISYLPRTTIKAQDLANFISEMTGTLMEEAPKKEVWLLHVDGSAVTQGNETSIVITSPQGEDMKFAIRFEFKAFNNEAEYEALTIGMRMGHEVGARRLVAYLDSQLIVK
ncbi:hypothetical protein Sango_1576300 [Sesamum angolense]|uniref:RNase H type-1 domain-containing protein n=1 Tax=Sesamum angolense TaxID=2727404 RepID=A0AAE2BTQ7_9LAMI|nr:hypothetical protein Sango_1576300 [Sesamum angolense]